jgi:hypothetical protein
MIAQLMNTALITTVPTLQQRADNKSGQDVSYADAHSLVLQLGSQHSNTAAGASTGSTYIMR